jgi:sugar lactone lactonase YvrE
MAQSYPESNFMRLSVRLLLALIVSAGGVSAAPAGAQTIVTLGTGFSAPSGVAVDANGNVFVADQNNNAVKEILASGAFVTVSSLASGFNLPEGVAVDSAGNVYVADALNSEVKEIVAAGGFTTVKTLGSGFNFPEGVAVDGSGNVYVADTGNNAVKEILAAGGFVTVKTLAAGFSAPAGVAVDGNGNVFVADQGNKAVQEILVGGGITPIGGGFSMPAGVAVDSHGNVFVADQGNNSVDEILAAGGFVTVNTLGSGFNAPEAVAVDVSGNVYVADTGSEEIKEILATAPAIVASVLPGSRSVELGNPLTLFATMINSGTTALANCQIALAGVPPAGLTLTYQTTNPATNVPTGQPNTPVSIQGNAGTQSFVVSFRGASAFSELAIPLDFSCNDAPPAASVAGVDTVDLTLSSTPVPDIIAIAATVTNNAIVELTNSGAGAVAIASTNLGVTAPITVSVDTGAASLPLTAVVCQTNPSTGQCIGPAAATITLNYAAAATPTFSVFLQSSGNIAFAPGSSRVFVRFEDANGGLHGSTSVAIESN